MIQGQVKSPHLNGSKGVVERFLPSLGWFEVAVKKHGNTLKYFFKPQNLTLEATGEGDRVNHWLQIARGHERAVSPMFVDSCFHMSYQVC